MPWLAALPPPAAHQKSLPALKLVLVWRSVCRREQKAREDLDAVRHRGARTCNCWVHAHVLFTISHARNPMRQASRGDLETFMCRHTTCRWRKLMELCKERVEKSFECDRCDVCKLISQPKHDFTREVKFLLEVLKAGGATSAQDTLPWFARAAHKMHERACLHAIGESYTSNAYVHRCTSVMQAAAENEGARRRRRRQRWPRRSLCLCELGTTKHVGRDPKGGHSNS